MVANCHFMSDSVYFVRIIELLYVILLCINLICAVACYKRLSLDFYYKKLMCMGVFFNCLYFP